MKTWILLPLLALTSWSASASSPVRYESISHWGAFTTIVRPEIQDESGTWHRIAIATPPLNGGHGIGIYVAPPKQLCADLLDQPATAFWLTGSAPDYRQITPVELDIYDSWTGLHEIRRAQMNEYPLNALYCMSFVASGPLHQTAIEIEGDVAVIHEPARKINGKVQLLAFIFALKDEELERLCRTYGYASYVPGSAIHDKVVDFSRDSFYLPFFIHRDFHKTPYLLDPIDSGRTLRADSPYDRGFHSLQKFACRK